MENLFLIIMVFVLWSAGEGGAMLAACLLVIPNDPSPTSMGYTITKFLPGFFSSYRTHVHMGSDHWVALSVTPSKSFLKPCEDLVKTVNVVNVVKI